MEFPLVIQIKPASASGAVWNAEKVGNVRKGRLREGAVGVQKCENLEDIINGSSLIIIVEKSACGRKQVSRGKSREVRGSMWISFMYLVRCGSVFCVGMKLLEKSTFPSLRGMSGKKFFPQLRNVENMRRAKSKSIFIKTTSLQLQLLESSHIFKLHVNM